MRTTRERIPLPKMACDLLSLAAERLCLAGTETREHAHPPRPVNSLMTAEYLVRLLEEMMDLKVQQYAESQLKVTPEVAALLHDKRETDRRRLDQIRIELVRFLET
jgi:hypothetical protein